MRSKRYRHQHGFTLIECLLAGVILALFGAALAGMIAQANAVARRAHDNRVAAQWLDEVLTRIDIVGPNRMLYEGPLAGPLDDRFSWSAQITPEPLSDLYVVDVTIAWTTPAGQRTAEGHTLLMDPPGWREASVSWASLQ